MITFLIRQVREAAAFRRVQTEIDQIVCDDFERCRKYAQQFEEHRVIHVFGQHWNFEAYAEVQFNASFRDTVANFTSDMRQLSKWYKDLDKGMKVAGSERNLNIDSKGLKSHLVTVTQRALDRCRGLLLQVARSCPDRAEI